MHSIVRLTAVMLLIPIVFAGCCDDCDDDPVVPQVGTITMDPDPNSIDAPWQLTGPGGFDQAGAGNLTLTDMALGSYTLTWGEVVDWTIPDPVTESQTLVDGGVITFTGHYAAPVIESAPVAPTQVYSVSGDERITIYWSDFPEDYSTIDHYRVYSRFYQPGDEGDSFYEIGRVPVGTDHDALTGQYHFVDQGEDVENGIDYEYAVSAVSQGGLESRLSSEVVIDTPLPMSEVPVEVFDAGGSQVAQSGFDFSLAAGGADGRVDPGAPQSSADVRVIFRGGIPYLEAMRGDVHVQDYGTFIDRDGDLYFEGVSWAPDSGYSSSGVLELIDTHVYVLEIVNEDSPGSVHYAKLGVAQIHPTTPSVHIMWAYQLVDGLPELIAPAPREALSASATVTGG